MRVVNDRRSSARVTVRGEAFLYASSGSLRCRCLDISPTGMSVVSPQAIKPRQRVRIESSFKGQRLVIAAQVVRRSRTRQGHVLGLRFEELGPAAHQQLEVVLRSMQVQAALAQQSCSIVERLPTLQLPEPEPEPQTERSPPVERAAWPEPVASPPVVVATPVASPPVVATPVATPRPRVATPGPRPRIATPVPAQASLGSERWDSTMVAPSPAHAPAQASPSSERWDSTMVAPSPVRDEGGPPSYQPFGLGEGWTEDELETAHYRPEDSVPPASRRPTLRERVESTQVIALELDVTEVNAPDAVDCTEVEVKAGTITVAEAAVPDWEPGAPAALAELVETDAGTHVPPLTFDEVWEQLQLDDPPPAMDRTMVTPGAALASFATLAPTQLLPAPDPAADGPAPARTGQTIAIHVQDLRVAFGEEGEPELDLPELEVPSTTEPMTPPRLSEDLQAALARLRRREDREHDEPVATPPSPSPRRPERKLGATDIQATSRREDTQLRALYHEALAQLAEPEPGDGS